MATVDELQKEHEARLAQLLAELAGRGAESNLALVRALIHKGVHLAALGRPLTDYTVLDLPRPTLEGDVLRGVVVRVDRFGNVVTNLDRKSCERLADGTGSLQLTVGGRSIARIVSTYSEIAPGDIGALFGGTDHLECAAQAASASEVLGVSVGDLVELRRI